MIAAKQSKPSAAATAITQEPDLVDIVRQHARACDAAHPFAPRITDDLKVLPVDDPKSSRVMQCVNVLFRRIRKAPYKRTNRLIYLELGRANRN
jgi:hypothetical protein